MKKKNRKEDLIGFVLMCIFIFILILSWVLVQLIFNKPQITIYEEVCRNEIDYMHSSESPEVIVRISDSYLLEDLGFLAFNKVKDKYTNPSLYKYKIDDLFKVNDTHKFYHIWIDIVHEVKNEVCEQVEVDGIEIYDEKYEGDYEDISNGMISATYGDKIHGTCDSDNKNCVFYKNYMSFQKSQIDKEWLDGNCECLGSLCNGVSTCCSGEYKCFNKYLVEVGK